MISPVASVVAGLLICLPFTVFVVISFRLAPRLWLHSLPPDIAEVAGPKTPKEEWLTRWLMMPLVLAILPGLSVASAYRLAASSDVDLTFAGSVVHLYIVWAVVHVWDFVGIDVPYATLIDSKRPPIPGTEGVAGWNDYRFHLRSLARALLLSAIFVLPAAAATAWLW